MFPKSSQVPISWSRWPTSHTSLGTALGGCRIETFYISVLRTTWNRVEWNLWKTLSFPIAHMFFFKVLSNFAVGSHLGFFGIWRESSDSSSPSFRRRRPGMRKTQAGPRAVRQSLQWKLKIWTDLFYMRHTFLSFLKVWKNGKHADTRLFVTCKRRHCLPTP